MNILTFDVEEWFHLLDFDATRTEAEWVHYPCRIYDNVERIFRILDDTHTRATFFVIGWVARQYPDLVRRIAEHYEVGCHTMSHQLVWQQGREAFQRDAESAIKLLQDITGQPVRYFRAPGFSIRETEAWAFADLADLGIEVDCSVCPAHHSHGGFPSYGRPAPSTIAVDGREIKELPVTTKHILGRDIVFCGGGYFRLFPYWFIKRCAREHADYLLSYIHPRDLDAGQPMLEGLPLMRRFKSYVGLGGAEKKLRRLLTEFEFTDVGTALAAVDWGQARRIEL